MAVAIVSEDLLAYVAAVKACIEERGYADALDSGPSIRHLGHWLVWMDNCPPGEPAPAMLEHGHELVEELFTAVQQERNPSRSSFGHPSARPNLVRTAKNGRNGRNG